MDNIKVGSIVEFKKSVNTVMELSEPTIILRGTVWNISGNIASIDYDDMVRFIPLDRIKLIKA